MQLLTGYPFEMRPRQSPCGSPAFGRRLGYRGIVVVILLDEFHIAMPPDLMYLR